MKKFKNVNPDYSPAQQLWAMTCHCSELLDELREIVKYDEPLSDRIEYHRVMISIVKFRDALQELRKFSSKQTFKAISDSKETWLPFPEDFGE